MLASFLFFLPLAHADGLEAGPWVQYATENQAWILWDGDPNGVVEWGTAVGLGRETPVTSSSGDVQEAQLTGLDPGTSYYYRVRHGEGSTDIQAFRSAKAGAETAFRFVVLSDTQHDGSNPDKWGQIAAEGVITYARDSWDEDLQNAIDLVLVPGDLVENGWEQDQWRDEFIGPAQELMAAVPFYPAIGNHEANSSLYFDTFHLPLNGTADHPEHWWYLDYVNARFIGLNSNTPYTGDTQKGWLHEVLDDSCDSETLDFVFVQMHHPYQSELWPPGETDFTGEVIDMLDGFVTDCGKPAVHFFGHTHGYSRGQSRDARHLWVNVATAGGNIDYWDEYEQVDYDAFQVSLDEYGFVAVEVSAGDNAGFRLRRIGLGDEASPAANEERDFVSISLDEPAPATPEARSPADDEVAPYCLQLASSPYCDPDDDLQGASHWQIATDCEAWDEPHWEAWFQHENWYRDVDLQENDHLGDMVIEELEPNASWCWRVRHRDRGLAWSAWSEPAAFTTGEGTLGDNLLDNPGAEQGTASWFADAGPLEALEAGECDGGEPHQGQAYFAVGGVCETGVDHAEATQTVDVSSWADRADSGELAVRYAAWLASYSGSDLAEIELRFLDATGGSLEVTERLSEPSVTWIHVVGNAAVPAGTRAITFAMLGTRNAGQDCDAYFDDLELRLATDGSLDPCLTEPDYPYKDEEVSCADTGLDEDSSAPGETGDSGKEARRCGCAGGSNGPGWGAGLALVALIGARRHRSRRS